MIVATREYLLQRTTRNAVLVCRNIVFQFVEHEYGVVSFQPLLGGSINMALLVSDHCSGGLFMAYECG